MCTVLLYYCKCVLYYCHRVTTQLQFKKYIIYIISRHVIYHIIYITSHHIIYHILSYHIIHFIYHIYIITHHIIYHIKIMTAVSYSNILLTATKVHRHVSVSDVHIVTFIKEIFLLWSMTNV